MVIGRTWFFLGMLRLFDLTFLRISIDGRDRVHTSIPSPPNPLDQKSLSGESRMSFREVPPRTPTKPVPAISSRQTGEACGFFQLPQRAKSPAYPRLGRNPDSGGPAATRPRQPRCQQTRASATTSCRNTIPSRRQSGQSAETLLPPEPATSTVRESTRRFPMRTPPHDRSNPVEDKASD
jgi:hypothetical protein